MSGTLVTNFVQPDLNTDLTLNQRNSTGNTVAIGALYAGQNANTPLAGATNPTIGSIQSANNYIQNYVFNTANGSFSSADFTAYPNNGTDASGWVDMGITSNNYSQATYSITGRNEGYVIMSAPSGSGTSGNLVIGTDSTGAYNSIQVYTKGFAQSKANAVVTIDGATGAMSTLNTINVPNTFGFKNRLINGNMNIWQRGTAVTFLNGNGYVADRWCAHLYQQSRHQRVAVTSPPSGLFSKYALRASSSTTSESASGTRMDLNQTVESFNCQDLSGQLVTLSFWIKFSAATISSSTATPYGDFTAGVAVYTATTDGATGTTFNDGVTQLVIPNGSLPTTWTKYTLTALLPSGVNNVGTIFQFSGLGSTASADTAYYDITQVQLEKGTWATSYDIRPYSTELALCQRYLPVLQTNGGTAYLGVGICNNSTNFQSYYTFKVTPRVIPTGIIATAASGFLVNDSVNVTTATGLSILSASYDQCLFNVTVASGLTQFRPASLQFNNGSQIQFTGCEL
jgi:hypothetical protein